MSPPRTRTLLVEDQGIFRAFLENWLAPHPRFEVVGAAASGEDALSLLAASRPELMVVDLQLPGMDGLEFARAARQARPQARVLLLSSLIDPLTLTRVRESGVEGYLEKDTQPERLEEAMHAVADGRPFFSARFAEVISREGVKAEALGKILSRREQEVLSQIIAGKTSREIADFYGIGLRTVEFHRANVMAKFGATNTAELLSQARARGVT
ncbi:response regulator transcription factor [Haloferula sp. BvORR071]|uniref:response regulator n=1 Tax=Haloferula sp. BvORR071 TaxID=1396141 RepID=UPI00055599E8|nr:response regulator transcription factor [Haloferula sp. BvORR071]